MSHCFWLPGVIMALMISTSELRAELYRFESADGSKNFMGELTGYDPKTQTVSVKINRRIQTFKIDLLSRKDQMYVMEHGERLEIANNLNISLESYTDKYTKRKGERIEDRVYPTGYEIKIDNRSKQSFENLKLSYTIYYGVQGYIEPERETKTMSGELLFKFVPALKSTSQRTEPVEIVSGKMEPLFENETVRGPDGTRYTQSVIKEPGGRRKDQLIGCTIKLALDGKVVKTITEGKIQLEKEKRDL